MRRIALVLLVFVIAGASGCISPESKRQWNSALGDLSGENTKTIAPLGKKVE